MRWLGCAMLLVALYSITWGAIKLASHDPRDGGGSLGAGIYTALFAGWILLSERRSHK
jgi:hypothetical protein